MGLLAQPCAIVKKQFVVVLVLTFQSKWSPSDPVAPAWIVPSERRCPFAANEFIQPGTSI